MLQTAKIGRAPLDLAEHLALDGSRITIENLGGEMIRFAPGPSGSGDDAPTDLRAGFLLRPGERRTMTPAAADAPLWAWGGGRIAVGPALAPAAGGGSGGGGGAVSGAPVTRRAETTMTAAQIADLATTRRALLAADADHTVIPLRLIVRASGGTAPARVSRTNLWVSLAPTAGGLYESTTGAPDFFTIGNNTLYFSSSRSGASGWLRPGGYTDVWIPDSDGRVVLSGGGRRRVAWDNLPLTIVGYAEPASGSTAAQQWAAATAGLGTLTLTFVLLYELWSF